MEQSKVRKGSGTTSTSTLHLAFVLVKEASRHVARVALHPPCLSPAERLPSGIIRRLWCRLGQGMGVPRHGICCCLVEMNSPPTTHNTSGHYCCCLCCKLISSLASAAVTIPAHAVDTVCCSASSLLPAHHHMCLWSSLLPIHAVLHKRTPYTHTHTVFVAWTCTRVCTNPRERGAQQRLHLLWPQAKHTTAQHTAHHTELEKSMALQGNSNTHAHGRQLTLLCKGTAPIHAACCRPHAIICTVVRRLLLLLQSEG